MEGSEALTKARAMQNSPDSPAEGNFWKGIAIGLGCQLAYLALVASVPSAEVRRLGYLMFALVQIAYLYPLVAYFQRRKQPFTSSALLLVGIVSLFAAAGWFGYSILRGLF